MKLIRADIAITLYLLGMLSIWQCLRMIASLVDALRAIARRLQAGADWIKAETDKLVERKGN